MWQLVVGLPWPALADAMVVMLRDSADNRLLHSPLLTAATVAEEIRTHQVRQEPKKVERQQGKVRRQVGHQNDVRRRASAATECFMIFGTSNADSSKPTARFA